MRAVDPASSEPREPSLFEQWMGMTLGEWEALGDSGDTAPDGQLPLI
jgi:hypothetical protein